MQVAGHVTQVLLIEDDEDLAHAVQSALEPLGFRVTHTLSLGAGRRALAQAQCHAIVLDLTLPDGDGLDFVASLRASGSELPVIMLTARDTVPDRLIGFDRGADDYLGKPFDVDELAARLRVVLRRARGSERHLLRYADLELDLLTRKVRRPGVEVTLSDREAELLAFMMRHTQEVLARQTLLDELWGDEADESSNLVNVYINLLRNKIESPAHRPLIRTVRGIGYVLSEEDPDMKA